MKKLEVTTMLPALTVPAAQKTANTLSTNATELVIDSAEAVAQAAELDKKFKAAEERIDEEEAKVLDHLKAAQKAEKARWQPMRDLLTEGRKKIRSGIMEYRTQEQAKLAAATAQVNAAVASGRIKKESTAISKINAIEASAMGKSVSTGTASAQFKTVYKLKIVDESKIPRAYMTPATKLIEAALKAGKTVPGCEWKPEEQLAIK